MMQAAELPSPLEDGLIGKIPLSEGVLIGGKDQVVFFFGITWFESDQDVFFAFSEEIGVIQGK